jgi:GAF domain-containing protein
MWAAIDQRRPPCGLPEGRTRPVPGVSDLVAAFRREGYAAVNDVAASSLIPDTLRRSFLRHVGVKAFLVIPVYVRGDLWGFLAVEYLAPRVFSGKEVHLLQTAATQVSQIVLLSQQMRLHEIDHRIAEEVRLPKEEQSGSGSPKTPLLGYILECAIELTGCQGGHIRTVDRFTGTCVMEVAAPYLSARKPPWRLWVLFGEPVAGEIAKTGEVRVVNDVSQDPFTRENLKRIPASRPDVRKFLSKEESYACIPLIADGEVLGTLSLSGAEKGHFTAGRMGLLMDFARRAALALRAERYLERMLDMNRLIDPILKDERLEDLWPRIPEVAVRLFQAEDAAVSSYDKHTNLLRRERRFSRVAAKAGEGDEGREASPSDKKGCGFVRWVARTRRIVRLEGKELARHLKRSRCGPKLGKHLPSGEIRSVMVGPLLRPDGELMGVLKAENRRWRLGNRGFTEFDEALMELVCAKFAIAIQHLRALAEKERFISTQTHDLRTPLQAVRGVVENLASKDYSLPTHEGKVRMACRYASHLEALVRNALDVARGGCNCQDKRIWRSRVHPRATATDRREGNLTACFTSTCAKDKRPYALGHEK